MEQYLNKSTSKKLPLVYPLIFYSGKKTYPYSVGLFDLFQNQKTIAKEIFLKPLHLIDLTQVSDEDLKRYRLFGTMALLAKHIHDPDILPVFKGMLAVLRELEIQGETGYIKLAVSYVVEAGEISSQEAFIETVKTGLEHGEEIMTLAERWKQEGFEKGKALAEQVRKEALLEGKLETALNLLKLGIPPEHIFQATGLTLEQIQNLKKKHFS